MGFFDDINEIVSAIKEPLQDISETVQMVKDDAVASFTQVGDDVSDLTQEGAQAVNELKSTVDGITGKKPGQ